MTAILYFRDGRVEVIEEVFGARQSFYNGFCVEIRERDDRDNLDIVKIELLP